VESKAFDSSETPGVWRARSRQALRCPSVLDVAGFESGTLSGVRRAVIDAHSRRCPYCACSLAELQQARLEILGLTPGGRAAVAQRAADEIETLLRRRLH
jgi:hypothetical protein